MHDDRKLAGNRDGGALEADLLAKLYAPTTQIAVGMAAGRITTAASYRSERTWISPLQEMWLS